MLWLETVSAAREGSNVTADFIAVVTPLAVVATGAS